MQKKSIKIGKSITALIMCLVLLVSSLPFALAATAGAYDPAPYWGEDSSEGAFTVNFVATVNADNSITVSFPHANAQKTYDGADTKYIASYIVMITEMQSNGTRTVLLQKAYDTASIVAAMAADYDLQLTVDAATIASVLPSGYQVGARYDVALMAVDNEGWASDWAHTLASETPYYNITENWAPEEDWVGREMLNFEAKGSWKVGGVSPSSTGSENSADYLQYGQSQAIDANGKFTAMGESGTNAYRFWINSAYSGTAYSFDTSWSREHYDFGNAQEVWFYLDLSDVELDRISFNLRPNNKDKYYWWDGTDGDGWDAYGVLFSTKSTGADSNTAGEKGDVYIQNADGMWEEITMTDGYVSGLGGYKGYIRIPVSYFLLQEDQYITGDNTNVTNPSAVEGSKSDAKGNAFTASHRFLQSNNPNGWTFNLADGSSATAEATTVEYGTREDYADTMTVESLAAYRMKVNPKGTPVNEALLIQNVYIQWNGSWSVSDARYYRRQRQIGWVLAPGTTATVTDNADGSKNYQIDRENAPKAINDMMSAGFEIDGWSDDSVKKSFYLDQVIFCQKTTDSLVAGTDYDASTNAISSTCAVQFPTETGGFSGDYGYRIAKYYDRTVEVPKSIAEYILTYCGDIPSLDDVDALNMIDSLIEVYIDCFPGCSTVAEAIASMETAYPEAVARYTASKAFMEKYVGSGSAAKSYNAVAEFERGVEQLPKVEFADTSSTELKTTLKELMALYQSFNLGQFELLGKEMEEKFLTLYNLMMGDEVKTGYSIGAYPFIPFNDFETNYTVGQRSLKYYDDWPTRQDNVAADVNNTKNLVSYTTSEYKSHTTDFSIGWEVTSYTPSSGNKLGEDGETYYSWMDAEITDSGFNRSKGVTAILNGDLNNSGSSKKYAVVSVTYQGANANTWSELPGLDLSALYLDGTSTKSDGKDSTNDTRYGSAYPNSFVMYLDYSDVQDLAMNIRLICEDKSTGNDVVFYYCAGRTSSASQRIYQLDENGEWEAVELSLAPDEETIISAWAGCSTIMPGENNNLQNYQGFIQIPLSKFRLANGSSPYYFDNELQNYTVKQVKVAFWDFTGGNVGKSVTIDAMGFTYDPSCTSRTMSADAIKAELNSDNGITVTNMDEYFKVKTNDSSNFERMVSELSPYVGEGVFKTNYEACETAYNNLSAYQKAHPDVVRAYNELTTTYKPLYDDYATEMAKEAWAPDTRFDTDIELTQAIEALDDKAKNADVTSDGKQLVTPYDYASGTIDYSALGIADAAAAEDIVAMYEKGYMRSSDSVKASISEENLTALKNAYAAAKRILELTDDMTEAQSFRDQVAALYEADTGGLTADPSIKYISCTNTNIDTTLQQFNDMSVFAKAMVTNATSPELASFAKMYNAVKAIGRNATEKLQPDGSTALGGIVQYTNRIDASYAYASPLIAAKAPLDDVDKLKEIEYCLGQYEALLPRYFQVKELSEAYAALAKLFPVAEVTAKDAATGGNDITATGAALDNGGKETVTVYADMSYVAARYNHTVTLKAVSDLKLTQTAGEEYTALNAFAVDGMTADTELTLGTFLNSGTNTLSRVPIEVSVDSATAANVTKGATYEGSITLNVYDSDNIEGGVIYTVDVPVTFTSTDGPDPHVDTYTVTYPAEISVDWNDSSAKDASYSVTCDLAAGAKLDVLVTNDGTNQMSAEGTSAQLTYTPTNFGAAETFTGTNTDITPTNKPTVAVSGWSSVPVGAYKTTLTYTVSYTPAP
ncbi:MAG: hypothetical protein ACI4LB_08615 [Candidatus Fimenecus sp.]